MVRVGIAGGVILAIGAGTLVLAFRAFGKEKSLRGPILLGVAIGFVLMVCLVLMRLAFVR